MSRASAFRDLGAAAFVVGGVLAVVYVWSGVWPPLVVIESSSMMHPETDTPYGKIGTIDPGDMVFVKQLDPYANGGRGDVELLDERGATKDRYGKTGDVVVFYADGVRSTARGPATPIIHRAVAWVDVTEDPEAKYVVEYRGETLTFNETAGITIGELSLSSYKPAHGGYITKGDNPVTNRAADQAGLARQPTKPDWVTGKARGEIPWFGLIKLMIGTELKNPPGSGEPAANYWVRVGNVYAPGDLWVMLASSVLAIVVVPLGWDVWRALRDRREDAIGFETIPVTGPARPRVRPLPPPDLAERYAGRRLARFEQVRR